MKHPNWILLVGVLLTGSCAPASTPTATAVPPTVAVSPTAQPTASEAPTLAPVALAGPQAATSMAWLDGAVLLYVPAGNFTMGTGITSTPEKTIYLDGYWIYETDVTNKMYAQCVSTGNCAAPAQEIGTPVYSNPEFGDYPVVGVSWDMAANYCQWAQGQLPTEAQWEKAARGDSGALFPWGIDTPSCALLNYKGCLGHTNDVTDYPGGHSPYGAYGLAGNVFQWVNDFYDEHYYDSMPSRNPTGPASGDYHSLRGSSFETEAKLLQSGVRHFGAAAYHSGDLGFRCAVNQPKVLAPYCQSNSYIPTGAGPSVGACQSPEIGLRRNYCTSNVGYATSVIPAGATWRSTTKGYSCTDAVVNGQRILTCTGPDSSTGKVTVCNAACSAAPSETGAPIVCDPGYNLDASTHSCIYSPVSGQPAVSGCAAGYNLVQRGALKLCAVGRNQNGECPAATYFDGQYGACASPAASADAPYAIDNPALASQTYQGCANGYSYDPAYQCCQASAGGAYPGCPIGFTFDATQKTCVPRLAAVSGPGCVTISLNIDRCASVLGFCENITDERACIRANICHWDDRRGLCTLIKPGQ